MANDLNRLELIPNLPNGKILFGSIEKQEQFWKDHSKNVDKDIVLFDHIRRESEKESRGIYVD